MVSKSDIRQQSVKVTMTVVATFNFFSSPQIAESNEEKTNLRGKTGKVKKSQQ